MIKIGSFLKSQGNRQLDERQFEMNVNLFKMH